MTSTGSYDIQKHNITPEAELQRLQTQATVIWKKEARTLQWFGIKDGMSVVELGSGPGFTTEQLCSLLPNSEITSVELDPFMVQQAQNYLKDKGGDRVNFVEGSITDTGLPDNSFDFAFARLIFQHIPEPVAAAQEIRRILKPGGKLVIVDTDADIFGLFDPPTPSFTKAIDKFSQASQALGGNFRIGRYLWRILQEAGFEHLDLEAVVAHSDELGIEPFAIHPLNVDLFVRLVKMGLMTEEELASLRQSKEDFLASPHPFVLVIWLMACGAKPVN
ncbi:unknown [Crocosphaera subtropica ATCC 51142]|uniref:Methyltransferase type 11 domain-containing protein n=1 Tax=Crocosphaera subtropica (strain ATCC 51142 / BH68) TaxID=43989 RepID=B1X1T0_CROS5|nr:methyltransferase domain-containing protein [Crocosphaera subtropica]ACB53110.1 unknown [Crocosphaera subtropica ATCC 51142]